MKAIINMLLMLCITALCLQSDTAAPSSTPLASGVCQARRTERNSSTSSASCGGIGQRPRYSEYRNWTFQPATLPCASTPK